MIIKVMKTGEEEPIKIRFKDLQPGVQGIQGEKGDDGYSPVVDVTDFRGGHRVTITDATHPEGQSFDVMDGPVGDVMIGGTSIVEDNTAVIPTATNSVLGLVKIGGASLGVRISGTGVITTQAASSSEIKLGTQQYNPVVPNRQHESVFYGLAKAAGDTTQSRSANAVGTYTEDAKSKIKDMLDIHDGASDAGDISYDRSETYDTGSVGAELKSLRSAVNDAVYYDDYEDYEEDTVGWEIHDLRVAVINKVDKVAGKGLSANDYTSEEKTKLAGIEAEANKTIIDGTLTQQGQAADAKAVGDSLATKGSYSKPSTGIPKADLANGVQGSLDNADSAYQKPSTGIPKADLEAAVQTSLGKADTALQSAPVSSVAGKTGAVTLDAGDSAFSDSATYGAGTVGSELNDLKTALSDLEDDKIDAPSSPATGAFLVYSGTAWVAQTLATWQGGNY